MLWITLGHTVIVTGFYVIMAGKPETDGPPGAIAIGRALQALGRKVTYVTDSYTAPVLQQWAGEADVVEFPISGIEESKRHAAQLLQDLQPALLISIERCGRSRNDTYLNMRARDITPQTARLDYLFDGGIPSVGIGDGGNEIGMGNLVDVIPSVDSLPDDPAISRVDRLVIASVSNWGGYGLVAALSQICGRNILPVADDEAQMVQGMIDAGAVDGTTGDAVPTVDNFSMDENSELLARLHSVVSTG
ncbi:D-glutamate cyclase, mitochondrial [Geodia barretti]|uniref:D-glutamate cyclase, mitochondrial n=1 Tax=Geodia barretti TaxID=519541 RepID=A0AA35T5G0_GEOBA|nr:D-glutamate cyclase, mitochondrial [Geodia barretti]